MVSIKVSALSWYEKMGNHVIEKSIEKAEQRIADKADEANL